MSTQLLIAALVAGSIYALIALGLNLIYGTMRLLNVAHGEVVMIGAYVAYWGISLFSVGPLVSALVAIPLAAALGALIYLGIFRKAMRSAEFMERIEGNSLLVFFGVSVILQNGASLLFTICAICASLGFAPSANSMPEANSPTAASAAANL